MLISPKSHPNPAITLMNAKPRHVREKNAIPLLSKPELVCTCPINKIYAVTAPATNQYMDDVDLAHLRASDCAQIGADIRYVYHGC